MALNEPAIKKAVKHAAAENVRVEIADPDHRGLRLRLTPAGGATWVLGCRDSEGRARRYTLGTWPAMGVAAAREAAEAMKPEIRKGADPILAGRKKRLATKHAKDGIGTLQATVDAYANTDRARRAKSWAESKRRIESVFSTLLNRPVNALTRAELQLTANRWPSPQSAAAAVRYLRPVLKWAAENDLAAEDLARIKPPAIVGRRERVLSGEELGAILPVLRDSDRPYAAALRFLLLTLTRREEVCSAKWRDVDMGAATWTLPETKNGQLHVVPLSRQALDLLRARRPAKPRPDALVFTNRDGGSLANWDRETKAIMQTSRTEAWTRHDLRRTGATMLGEMGELPDIIEAALNHVSIRSRLAATYNRSRYRPAVAAALQRLADELDRIQVTAGGVANLHKTEKETVAV